MSKRVVAVHLPALPLEVVFADDPPEQLAASFEDQKTDLECGLATRQLPPCAVRQTVRGKHVLVAVSEAATQLGIRVGMSETEGQAMLASLAVRDREPSLELIQLEHAAELLFAYGPDVEVCPPSVLFVDVAQSRAALKRQLGSLTEEKLLEKMVEVFASIGRTATVAIADDPDTARTFAEHTSHQLSLGRTAKRVCVVPPGRAWAMMSRLPIEAIAWTDLRLDGDGQHKTRMRGVCEALRTLGIHTLGAMRRLPPGDLGTRFGVEGACLAARAQARNHRPLRGHKPSSQLEESYELGQSTEDLEPILFILRRLLHRLEVRLRAVQQAAQALTLEFLIEPRSERVIELEATRGRTSKHRISLNIQLARPTRTAASLFALIREKIGGALPGGVLELRVVVERSQMDRGAQLDLFSRREQKAEALGELVGRLSATLGEDAVFTANTVNTYRPESAWERRPFSVDAALGSKGLRPRSPPKTRPIVVEDNANEERALPVVNARLSVVGAAEGQQPKEVGDSLRSKTAWPKTKSRAPIDEPLAPLPPRPVELFEFPEPAMFFNDWNELSWRGQRVLVRTITGRERLRTEWWRTREQQLNRDYLCVETVQGHTLWVYLTPKGTAYVHGVFD